jgi:hypothetical protein
MEQEDADLRNMNEPELRAEVMLLRTAIRKHRDATGHDLCWYHPGLWMLLPEKTLPCPQVPEFCEFMQKCAAYRKSLGDTPPVPPANPAPGEPSPPVLPSPEGLGGAGMLKGSVPPQPAPPPPPHAAPPSCRIPADFEWNVGKNYWGDDK